MLPSSVKIDKNNFCFTRQIMARKRYDLMFETKFKIENQRSLVVWVIDTLGLPLSLELRVVDDLKNEKQAPVGQNFIKKTDANSKLCFLMKIQILSNRSFPFAVLFLVPVFGLSCGGVHDTGFVNLVGRGEANTWGRGVCHLGSYWGPRWGWERHPAKNLATTKKTTKWIPLPLERAQQKTDLPACLRQ